MPDGSTNVENGITASCGQVPTHPQPWIGYWSLSSRICAHRSSRMALPPAAPISARIRWRASTPTIPIAITNAPSTALTTGRVRGCACRSDHSASAVTARAIIARPVIGDWTSMSAMTASAVEATARHIVTDRVRNSTTKVTSATAATKPMKLRVPPMPWIGPPYRDVAADAEARGSAGR